MNKVYKVGIIGGGVSGVVAALQLAEMGVESILFEQKATVVNGPPFCHLHAGGNLYPDISDEQCRILMKESIKMARLFPQSIDERPTFISVPKSESYKLDHIEERLDMLVEYYKKLIEEDADNEVLGAPEDYYKIYREADLDALAKEPVVKRPNTPDEWMANAAKLVDYGALKMPVLLVQEYGWNLFRLGAQAQVAINKTDKCTLKLNTKVENVVDVRDKNLDYNWEIHTVDAVYKVEYLVNSSGFRTGKFDDCLNLNVERLVEFKAAYVSQWKTIDGLIPEFIFHGQRGTPHGMAQLTPYCEEYYQIHGMTEDITLFKNGLVRAKDNGAQPQFDEDIERKLNAGWDKEDIVCRTENSIKYIAKFIPSFDSATVGGPPMYGAQQIPGDDVNLRVGEVSFPTKHYARSEIIKASSALTVANQIIDKMQEEKIIDPISEQPLGNSFLDSVTKAEIDKMASEFADVRGYPKALSRLVIDRG